MASRQSAAGNFLQITLDDNDLIDIPNNTLPPATVNKVLMDLDFLKSKAMNTTNGY